MTPFLHTVAEQLQQRFAGRLHRLAVVFPNRRPAVYFARHLQQVAKPPFFLPDLMILEELVRRSARLPIAEPLQQCFALYDAYSEAAGDKPGTLLSLDRFYPIGETLLGDFRELDQQLAPVADVFRTMEQLETIDTLFDFLTEEQKAYLANFWRGASGRSEVQQRWLELWQRLPAIYEGFHRLLEQQELMAPGRAWRELAEGGAGEERIWQGCDHVAFVGFNALTKSEAQWIKRWQGEGRASCWMDADAWYAAEAKSGAGDLVRMQEAGFFLRRNLYALGLRNELPLQDFIASRHDTIDLVAVQGHTAQAKYAAAWLQTLPANGAGLTAGILLADETLLLPLLQSLPETSQGVNVTMGFPLKQSVIYGLVQLFFDWQADIQQHRYGSIHHELAERWMGHPYCDWPDAFRQELRQGITREFWFRVPMEIITAAGKAPVAERFCSPLKDPAEAIPRLCEICSVLASSPAWQQDPLQQGMLQAASRSLSQLAVLLGARPEAAELSLLCTLVGRHLGGLSVAFEGEPLEGIQVMGWLESRSLDFDHLLILGAGEGTLPRIRQTDSYLPENLRRAFGLTLREDQDAISAYVFYRLLHRSQQLTLVYNAQITDQSTGEPSRFIRQVAFETRMKLNEIEPTFSISPPVHPPICISKTPDIMKSLERFLQADDTPDDKGSYLSPSALNSYLTCRLQFYFRRIAGLKPVEKPEEGVEFNTFGSLVHKLLELAYIQAGFEEDKPLEVTAELIDRCIAALPAKVDEAFIHVYRGEDSDKPVTLSGEMHIVREVVLQMAEAMLQEDRRRAPFTLLAMEKEILYPYPMNLAGTSTRVRLGGMIDRIDKLGDTIRLVDYKTGNDKLEFKGVNDLFERDTQGNKAAVQTLIYALLYGCLHPDAGPFEPALIRLKEVTAGKEPVTQFQDKSANRKLSAEVLPEYLPAVEEGLSRLLQDLFDPQQPFDQTTDVRSCEYCDYRRICGRPGKK